MSEGEEIAASLPAYRTAIDADIAAYAGHVRTFTKQQYGDYGAAVTGAFLDMLERGGKRLRGSLVMVGYEMLGGCDQTMIVRAATAIEMVHTYWLVIDDIQDRSALRRGKPTVHKMLASYLSDKHLKGDVEHGGISLALNAAVAGGHAAQMLIAGLNVEAELRSKAMGIVSQAAMVTGYGQTYDIMNELTADVSRTDIERTLEWKTSYYTFLNPLCVGMVLAEGGCEDTDAIRAYALPAGKAFQITDDIMGIFGHDEISGKSSMDDLREGKQTLLTYHALTHASPKDKTFLRRCLGNQQLTRMDAKRCITIIQATGALDFAKSEARKHVAEALHALDTAPANWSPSHIELLRAVVKALPDRLQ
jgi:geranylgeranyl diphosphate synthase type I